MMMSLSLPDEYAATMQRVAEAADVTYIDTEPVLAAHSSLVAEVRRNEGLGDRLGPEQHTEHVAQRLLQAKKWMFELDSRPKLSSRILLTHSDPALFMEPCHPTPLGYRIISNLIAETMSEQGLLK